MKRTVCPGNLSGITTPPPSKSHAQRVLAATALAHTPTLITNLDWCDDTRAASEVVQALGAQLERHGPTAVLIKPRTSTPHRVLACGESGLSMRMFSAIAATFAQEFTLTASGSLSKRPMGMMAAPLTELGVAFKTANGTAPLLIQGPMRGGLARVDGSTTSQFLTGLLLALPCCPHDSFLEVHNLRSRGYIDVTLQVLREFGISVTHDDAYQHFSIPGKQQYLSPGEIAIESDWSQAAFLLVAGALAGKLTIRGLHTASPQADRAILKLLQESGATISVTKDALLVEKSHLRPFVFDATDCPDLVPPLTVLALACSGRSKIVGMERLKHKESDRGQALVTEFTKLGARLTLSGNEMTIEGGRPLEGGTVASWHDHRIAMASAIAALTATGPVEIRDADCVSKSWPGFFDEIVRLGAKTTSQ